MRTYWLLGLTLLMAGAAWAANPTEELLPPDQAFKLETTVKDARTVEARWRIADGYYMYRDKLAFSTDTSGYQLGQPAIPDGKVKEDEFFGRVETYRHGVRIELPLERAGDAPRSLSLKVSGQGCADRGVCYPPFTRTAELTLPPAAGDRSDKQADDGDDSASRLATLTGQEANRQFLHPDKAFKFDATVEAPDRLDAYWQIADGYYLYRDKMQFTLKDAQGVSLSSVELPEGKVKEDEYFGRMQTYPQDVDIALPLQRDNPSAQTVTLEVQYQGCAEAGICYPPITKQAKLELPAGNAGAAGGGGNSGGGGGSPAGVGSGGEQAQQSGPTQASAARASAQQTSAGSAAAGKIVSKPLESGAPRSEQDRYAGRLATGGMWLNALAFFGAGLLLAFTPCVFPMIPILSGIIAGQGEKITTGKAFALSLTFVLAMAVTYTLAGVFVGLSGENVQAMFQSPWIIGIFAAIFVLLSLSMFGFYELQMPSAVQSRLSQITNRQEGGTFAGAGIMGLLSALIVGPCVTAPLIGALIYIAESGNAVLGGVALFALSLGMGAPLLVIGTSAGQLLPRAGPWMDTIKAVFGVLLLGVGIWLLQRILPAAVTMTLWALLLLVSGIYMGAFDAVRGEVSGWFRLWKGLGLAVSLYGALLLVGAAGGGHDVLQPLKGVATGGGASSAQAAGIEFEQIEGVDGLKQALARAAQSDRPVMLDFYADWCVSCKEMEKYTFSDPTVQAALSKVTTLQTDVTDNDRQDKALLKHLGLFGPPAIVFFDANGDEVSGARVVGYVPAEEFSQHVRRSLAVRTAGR